MPRTSRSRGYADLAWMASANPLPTPTPTPTGTPTGHRWFPKLYRLKALCLLMRDRDVRNAIQAALIATNAFNGVFVWGLPEDYGSGSSSEAAAAIIPQSSRQEDLWDAAAAGGLVITSRVGDRAAYRHDRPAAPRRGGRAAARHGRQRPERPEPGRPDVPADDPDHRMGLAAADRAGAADQRVFSYQYIVEGWDEYDTTP